VRWAANLLDDPLLGGDCVPIVKLVNRKVNVRHRLLMPRQLDCLFEVRCVAHRGCRGFLFPICGLCCSLTSSSPPLIARAESRRGKWLQGWISSLHLIIKSQTLEYCWMSHWNNIYNSDHVLLYSVRRATQAVSQSVAFRDASTARKQQFGSQPLTETMNHNHRSLDCVFYLVRLEDGVL